MKLRLSFQQVGLSLMTTLVIYAIVVSGLIIARVQPIIPVEYLFRDSFLLASEPSHYGFISNLGILLWCATATVSLYNAAFLWILGNSKPLVLFFLYSGLFVLWLTFDDFFMLHEKVFPEYFNISEDFIFVIYTVVGSLYLFGFSKEIMRTKCQLLAIAVVFLGLSMASDKLFEFVVLSPANLFLIEGGLKFLGIVSLFLYIFQSSLATAHHACLTHRSRGFFYEELDKV